MCRKKKPDGKGREIRRVGRASVPNCGRNKLNNYSQATPHQALPPQGNLARSSQGVDGAKRWLTQFICQTGKRRWLR